MYGIVAVDAEGRDTDSDSDAEAGGGDSGGGGGGGAFIQSCLGGSAMNVAHPSLAFGVGNTQGIGVNLGDVGDDAPPPSSPLTPYFGFNTSDGHHAPLVGVGGGSYVSYYNITPTPNAMTTATTSVLAWVEPPPLLPSPLLLPLDGWDSGGGDGGFNNNGDMKVEYGGEGGGGG